MIDDVQALERRLALKRRDGGVEHVILLLAETRKNRRALRAAPTAFRDLDRDVRRTLRALVHGTNPQSSALIFL